MSRDTDRECKLCGERLRGGIYPGAIIPSNERMCERCGHMGCSRCVIRSTCYDAGGCDYLCRSCRVAVFQKPDWQGTDRDSGLPSWDDPDKAA